MRLCLAPELQWGGLRHFVGARLVGWGIRWTIGLAYNAFREQISLDFFAADIGKHFAIDLDTGTEHLAASFDHFLALDGVVDNVAVFVGKIVFAHDGTHTLAPATRRFQVSDNLRFIHK